MNKVDVMLCYVIFFKRMVFSSVAHSSYYEQPLRTNLSRLSSCHPVKHSERGEVPKKFASVSVRFGGLRAFCQTIPTLEDIRNELSLQSYKTVAFMCKHQLTN